MPDSPQPQTAPESRDEQGEVEEFDLVVLGVGSGGEYIATTAARRGRSVAAVEARLLGGECPFWACIPSKVLLIAARAAREDGVDCAEAWRHAVQARVESVSGLDDSSQAEDFAGAGVTVIRGRGRVEAPDTVTVGEGAQRRVLRWREALIIGTGSTPVVPDLPGLSEVPTWTSDQALESDELPSRLLVLGGGAVGCELSQVYASFGVTVTLVETSDQVLPAEDSWVGEALAEHLGRSGVDVRAGSSLLSVQAVPGGAKATIKAPDGTEASLEIDRILVVTGRSPAGGDLGVELLGVAVDRGAITVDDRCRALDSAGQPVPGVLAVGDVTTVAPFTHTANHQARVVLANMAGHDIRTRPGGIPRAVYTEPPVFSVGLSERAAREAGHDVRVAHQDVAETARAFVETVGLADDAPGVGPAGLRLIADADGKLLGAAAVGPHADSWAGELALAVTAGLDVTLLAEHVRAFPTWSEAITPAALDLTEQVGRPVS